MKKILCYGDSNTYGYNADTQERFPLESRWSGVLTKLLANKYIVIEQGLNDRNGFVKNEKGSEYCAQENLQICLKENQNIDVVVLAVGTNDLQFAYNFDEEILKTGMLNLIKIVKEYNNSAKIIVVPPVKLGEDVPVGFFSYQFDDSSVEKSEKLFNFYKEIAEQNDCGYFDFNKIVRPVKKDGLHYSAESHRLIAEKFAQYIAEYIK